MTSAAPPTGNDQRLSGNPFGAVMFESMPVMLSHEIMETMSDPVILQGNDTGWYAQTGTFSTNNGEIADQCEDSSNGDADVNANAPLAGALEYASGCSRWTSITSTRTAT